jgi:hypothetical protein
METKNAKESFGGSRCVVYCHLTIQTATAAARHARKAARAPVATTQQLRDSHAQVAPPPVHTRSCDIFACYDD